MAGGGAFGCAAGSWQGNVIDVRLMRIGESTAAPELTTVTKLNQLEMTDLGL